MVTMESTGQENTLAAYSTLSGLYLFTGFLHNLTAAYFQI